MKRKAMFLAVASLFAEAAFAQTPQIPVDTLPTGGVVKRGDITINAPVGSSLTVRQTSARGLIDWTSFNIGRDASVAFDQTLGSAAVTANRVPGATAKTVIEGMVSAPGHVMVLNTQGVLFTRTATINVGSLTASTGQITESQFDPDAAMAITITGAAGGSVENQGHITLGGAGLVAFVAPSVINSGTITAVGGRIVLAGAQAATISLNDGLYEITVGQGVANSSVDNSGTLTTAATATGSVPEGTIVLSAPEVESVVSGAINLTGIQRANRIEVNGKVVELKGDLDATTVAGSSSTVNVYAGNGAQLQDAVDIAKVGTPGAGATVNVNGTFNQSATLTLNKANVTLHGQTGAKITVPNPVEPDGQLNGVTIAANNVTVSGLEIAGPVPSTTSYVDYVWGNRVTRGIVVQNGVTGFDISDNNIHSIRTGILVDGRNTGSITGNTIENTKSGISVQYTDGTGISIADNGEGQFGNEWGVNFHLNGFLSGGVPTSNSTAPSTPTAVWQKALLDLSTANHGWAVQDQFYTSSNRTRVVVSPNGSSSSQGSPLTPLNTIQAGINAVVSGGKVNVGAGTFTVGTTINVDKAVTLTGAGQSDTFIDARTVVGYGMLVTGDHVSLSEFTLYGPYSQTVDRANAYGIKVQPAGTTPESRLLDFNMTNVTSRGAGRAELDLNGVDGAKIDGFTAEGKPYGAPGETTKGAGIQITDSANIKISNSTTDHNAWGGIALFQANKPNQFNQQTANIKVEGNNTLNESNPLYLQDESTSKDFGSLDLQGFAYAVRNPTTFNQVIQSQFTWLQKGAQDAFNYAVSVGSPGDSYAQAWNGTGVTQSFAVGVGQPLAGGAARAMLIQTAVDHADTGAQIDIYPGRYVESVANRTSQGVSVNQAGLFVDKDNLVLRGVDTEGHAITDANNVQAWITAGGISNFGMAHGVVANNVTFTGLGFKPKPDDLNKTIEISGNNFTFANSVVDNRLESTPGGTTKAGGAGALYFGELDPANHQITQLTVTGSKFLDGSIVITEGVGASADGTTFQPAADRVISNNVFVGSSNYRFGGVLLNGKMDEINWRTKPIGAVTLAGNSFSGFDDSVLVRGEQQGVDLRQVMRDNTFDRSVLVTDAGGNARGELYASTMGGIHDPVFNRPKYSIQSSIGAGVSRAVTGDTVTVGKGTYVESVTIDKALTLTGAGKGLTVIDQTGSSSNSILIKGLIGTGTVKVSDLTVQGGANGIQVSDLATTLGTLTLERVVVRDSAGSGFISSSGGSRSVVSTINITDSVFAGNGGSNGSADINLFLFNGTANLTNVDILGTKAVGGAADYGLQIRGEGSLATMFAAGHVSLDSVRIAGNYKKSHLAIQRYSDAGNIVMSGVKLGGALQNVSVGNNATLDVSGSNADWGTFFSSDMHGNLSLGDTVFAGGVFNALYGDVRIGGDTGGLKVDASGVRFEVAGQPDLVPLADPFAVEDRVVHALDAVGGPGLVVWNPGNLYVTQKSGSVQRAVAAATTIDTINVAAVNFSENVVVHERRSLLFNGSTIGSLTIDDCACGTAIGGTVTATGSTGFKFDVPVVLLADTVLDTSAAGRQVLAASINGTTPGGQKLTIRAGVGNVALGSLGATTRLGAVDVSGAIRFTGSTYFANSLLFAGPMTLDSASTTFRTNGGNIVLNGDIQNAGGTPGALTLDAGSGDIMLVSGGTIGNPLGRLEVDANNFTLQSTLWVSGYDVNALGTVALSDHSLRSLGGVGTDAINAGGDVTGTTTSTSGVQIDAGGDVAANVTSQGPVVVEAANVTGNYTAPTIAFHAQETINVTVDVPGLVEVRAPDGAVRGNFGELVNTGSGLIDVNGRPQVNTTVAESASNNRVVPAEVTTAGSLQVSGPQSGGRRRRKPEDALDILENGESIEIDLTPG